MYIICENYDFIGLFKKCIINPTHIFPVETLNDRKKSWEDIIRRTSVTSVYKFQIT